MAERLRRLLRSEPGAEGGGEGLSSVSLEVPLTVAADTFLGPSLGRIHRGAKG